MAALFLRLNVLILTVSAGDTMLALTPSTTPTSERKAKPCPNKERLSPEVNGEVDIKDYSLTVIHQVGSEEFRRPRHESGPFHHTASGMPKPATPSNAKEGSQGFPFPAPTEPPLPIQDIRGRYFLGNHMVSSCGGKPRIGTRHFNVKKEQCDTQTLPTASQDVFHANYMADYDIIDEVHFEGQKGVKG